MRMLPAVLLALATPALAGTYRVTFLQQADCADIARWELWGQRASEATLTKRADIPPSALAAACSETAPNIAAISVNLKRGTWSWVLRVVATDGEVADSDPLAGTLPLAKPVVQRVGP